MISFRASHRSQTQYSNNQKNEKGLSLNQNILTDIFKSIKQNYSVNQFAIAIRQYILKHDCLHLKQKLINFFLICQNKLKCKSDQQWRSVVNVQLNIVKGLDCLQKYIQKITIRKGFDKIINRKDYCIITQNVVEEQTFQKITDQQIDQIEVSEKVKLKTRYFFKWTQFVENANNLKRIKLKQIDNLKKSLTFNLYAVKFSYFANWKKITKKTILNRQRFQKIQINKKIRLFRNSINAFYTKFEITKIENLLTQKIESSLNKQKIYAFFRKLRHNSLLQKRKQTKLLIVNKWVYNFISWITSQIVPLKSKTLNQNKKKSLKQYELVCQKQVLTSLKLLIQKNKNKLNQTQLLIKKGFMKKFCRQIKKRQSLSKNLEKLRAYIFTKKVQYTLTILKINKKINSKLFLANQKVNLLYNQQKEQQEQANILYTKKIIQLQSIRQKKINLNKVQQIVKKSLCNQVINNLKLIKNKRTEERLKIDQILRKKCQNFIKQLKKRQNKRNSIKLREIHYLNYYQTGLIRKVYFTIKNWQNYQIGEEQNINKLFSIFQRKYVQQYFMKIKNLSNLKKALFTIQSKAEKLLKKNAWDICFLKQIQLIRCVKKKAQQKKISSQRKLFQILHINVLNLHCNRQKVEQTVLSKLKLNFVSSIKQNSSFTKKIQLLQNFRASTKIIFCLKQLMKKKIESQNISFKYFKLQKLTCFKLLQKRIKEKRQDVEQIQQKQKAICVNQLKIIFKNGVRHYKNDKIYKISQTNKVQILKKSLLKNILRLIKSNLMNMKQKSKQIINAKQNKVKDYLKKEFLYQIIFQKNLQKTQQFCQINQKKCFLNFLAKVKKDLQNKQKLEQTLTIVTKTHSFHSFFNILKQQKQNIQTNTNKLMMLRVSNCFSKLCQNKNRSHIILEIQNNYEKLRYKKTVKVISILMKNCLIKKFDKIKNMCSVKNYAKNIKKRAFKGLKKMLLKIKQKQNRLKTEEEQVKKVQRSYSKLKKQSTLTETIQKFNIRHSRQIR